MSIESSIDDLATGMVKISSLSLLAKAGLSLSLASIICSYIKRRITTPPKKKEKRRRKEKREKGAR